MQLAASLHALYAKECALIVPVKAKEPFACGLLSSAARPAGAALQDLAPIHCSSMTSPHCSLDNAGSTANKGGVAAASVALRGSGSSSIQDSAGDHLLFCLVCSVLFALSFMLGFAAAVMTGGLSVCLMSADLGITSAFGQFLPAKQASEAYQRRVVMVDSMYLIQNLC